MHLFVFIRPRGTVLVGTLPLHRQTLIPGANICNKIGVYYTGWFSDCVSSHTPLRRIPLNGVKKVFFLDSLMQNIYSHAAIIDREKISHRCGFFFTNIFK